MSTRAANDYPGLGLPLRYWPQGARSVDGRRLFSGFTQHCPPSFPIGCHANVAGSKSVLLPVREVAMMAIMDRLTDKADWHRKVFDEDIVAQWKAEAMAIPGHEWMKIAAAPGSEWAAPRRRLTTHGMVTEVPQEIVGVINEAAFEYCIEELRGKAVHFEKTGLVPTLDASATVVKSDTLVPAELRNSLRQAFSRLQADQAGCPDWHPNSGDRVQDLVHPSLFPLVYGRSKVLKDELVTVAGAVDKWAGKGETIAKEPAQPATGRDVGGYDVPPSCWSDSYQWLPSNVSFRDDGSVKLTSYINNLSPARYTEIYATIEKLIETALPAWDQCLLEYKFATHYGPGRRRSRFAIPSGADDEIASNWCPPAADAPELAKIEVDLAEDFRWNWLEDEAEQKWRMLRTPVFREPRPFEEIEYDPYKTMEDLEPPLRRFRPNPDRARAVMGGLRNKFQDTGLQVIVKMTSIELTPDKPAFPAGGWHIEGLLNERICATALYYLDSENITDSSLSFRMQTSSSQNELQQGAGQDAYHWMECNYGTSFSGGGNGSCTQSYGSVDTRPGRLLAFPNVFQHRVSPFQLADPTKPGHRRFVALWLVDPHLRILSTANVPPQQQDWWTEAVFGASADVQAQTAGRLPAELALLLREKGVALPRAVGAEVSSGARLPGEILEMVRGEFSLSTMSSEEAKAERLKLMAERTAHGDSAAGEWNRAGYNFCEH